MSHKDKYDMSELPITSGSGAPKWKGFDLAQQPVEPDAFSYLDHVEGWDEVLRSNTREWLRRGMRWFRYTVVDEKHRPVEEGAEPAGYWVECWRKQPRVQADFHPPVTLADKPGATEP